MTQFDGVATLLNGGVREMLRAGGITDSEASKLIKPAHRAVTEMAAWCRAQPGDAEPFVLQRWRDWFAHNVDRDSVPSEVEQRAYAHLDTKHQQLAEEAAQYLRDNALDPAGLDPVRVALDHIRATGASRSSLDELVAEARAAAAQSRDFVRQHDLFDPAYSEPIVEPSPAHSQYLGISLWCPGGFETDPIRSRYFIGRPPQPDPAAYFRTWNPAEIRVNAWHEVIGHDEERNRAREHPSPARNARPSATFAEGYAVAAAKLLADRGAGGSAERVLYSVEQLRITANFLVDYYTHTQGWTEPQVIDLYTRYGQTADTAQTRYRRSRLEPTQLGQYFVGWSQVQAIVDSRPPGVTEKQWWNALMGQGGVAARHVHASMLSELPEASRPAKTPSSRGTQGVSLSKFSQM